MSRRLIISPRAQRDMDDIEAYTIQAYGEGQTDRYINKIMNLFGHILQNPEIGRIRHDIKPGYWSVVVEKHIVFYRIKKQAFEIVAILHMRMDILSRL